MLPAAPAPSPRLVRAAAAEREHLRGHRDRLLATRAELRAQLERIDASLREIDDRDALLERLTGPMTLPVAAAVPPGPAPSSSPGTGSDVPLRGPAIRRAAVEVLLAHPDRPGALHYRDWFALLCDAGYAVAGKDPLAVFLTQLGRSPAVRRGTESGIYELDLAAPRRLRAQLEALHDELRRLAATPGAGADLAAVRTRRAEITTRISRTEKALEEAEACLAGAAEAAALALAR